MKYDNYYKDKSIMFSNTQKSLLLGMIKHGILQKDENAKMALKIIESEINCKRKNCEED